MTMEMNFLDLPEECIAAVISFTSPYDACRISTVSKLLSSAADSNAAWERFLPQDSRMYIDHSLSIIPTSNSSSVSVNLLFSSTMEERFEEVAGLLMVCWFEIRGKISTSLLSKATIYGAYLVFKEQEMGAFGFESLPLDVSFRTTRTDVYNNRRVFLESGTREPREDGWLEIELGEYYVGFDEEDLEMSVLETRDGDWKGGIIVQGIEIRPKEVL